MTKERILEMVDSIEDYVERVNVDEMTGRLFTLGVKIEKHNDVEAGIEAALIVAFVEDKK